MRLTSANREFLGYLEGTQRSQHTIDSYLADLRVFHQYFVLVGKPDFDLSTLTLLDMERYMDYLATLPLKINSRRRTWNTARKLVRFLNQRGRLQATFIDRIQAPERRELIPVALPYGELREFILSHPESTPWDLRTKALLWAFLETGMQVSDAEKLTSSSRVTRTSLLLTSGVERCLEISEALASLLDRCQQENAFHHRALFPSFVRDRMLPAPISSRGIEKVFEWTRSKSGFSTLTPRVLRHTVVLHWHKEGISEGEIQLRLGLRSTYAFRAYRALFSQESASV